MPPPEDQSIFGQLWGKVLGDSQDTHHQQQKVTYGTTKHPFEVFIPGWQDVVHIKRPPQLSAHQVQVFYAAKHNNDLAAARKVMTDDQIQELQHRDLMARAIRASPAPNFEQKVTKLLVALDTAQDVLFTAEAATLPLAIAAPEIAGPILALENIIRKTLGVTMAATAVLTPVGGALAAGALLRGLHGWRTTNKSHRKRNQINSLRRRLEQELDVGANARSFLRLVKSPAGALLAAQSAETFTGIGTTIGQVFITADNAIYGAIKAAHGQKVVATYDPNASLPRKAFAGMLNTVYGWLDGELLSPEDHLQLQVAHQYNLQLVQSQYAVSAHFARIADLIDAPVPSTNVWSGATRAMLDHYGIPHHTPQQWATLSNKTDLTFGELNQLSTQGFSRVAAEMNHKIDRPGPGNLMQSLALQIRDTTVSTLTGEQKPAVEKWNEFESLTIAMAEHGPWTAPLEPIVTLLALDSLHLWWTAAKTTLTDPRTGQRVTPRTFLTVRRGFEDAFLPEVVAAGACPKYWQRAGHVGLALHQNSVTRASRHHNPKFTRPALTIARRTDGAFPTVIPPDVESGLDQLLDQRIADLLAAGQLVDFLHANPYHRPTNAQAGQDLYTPLAPDATTTIGPVHPADGKIPITPADLNMTVYLSDHNFGLYGATHKLGPQEGGHANDPVLSLPWGTRYAPQRNLKHDSIITAIDASGNFVGADALITRLLSKPDPPAVIWHPAYQPEPYLIVQWHIKGTGQQHIRSAPEEQLWGDGFTHIRQATQITIPGFTIHGQLAFVDTPLAPAPQYLWQGTVQTFGNTYDGQWAMPWYFPLPTPDAGPTKFTAGAIHVGFNEPDPPDMLAMWAADSVPTLTAEAQGIFTLDIIRLHNLFADTTLRRQRMLQRESALQAVKQGASA